MLSKPEDKEQFANLWKATYPVDTLKSQNFKLCKMMHFSFQTTKVVVFLGDSARKLILQQHCLISWTYLVHIFLINKVVMSTSWEDHKWDNIQNIFPLRHFQVVGSVAAFQVWFIFYWHHEHVLNGKEILERFYEILQDLRIKD